MHKNASKEIHKCEGCQLHAPIKASLKHDLVTVTSAWPFYKWGMNIVGPFSEARERIKFLLVAVDYFTKWPEVKPLALITGKQVIALIKNQIIYESGRIDLNITTIAKQVIKFKWKQIICLFGLPRQIVTDNSKQFADKPFSAWCTDLHIKQIFNSTAYPQCNGQVERMNRSIVFGIKTKVGRHGKDWLEDLPSVLWAIRTTEKTSHGRTPYSLVFGSEVVIPAEIGVATHQINN
ncbi:hypothetical protein L1987_30132 [Smallanthus sonchifolius]|uniref:Uncharacterized protein n=1 Tax=Smallanthus sonchifolius TaxID=185202 RepID=A0ACB9I3R7_9ASTR|nr:hypothetical protein L1987_30132 [Smallanthus sonchifolius]